MASSKDILWYSRKNPVTGMNKAGNFNMKGHYHSCFFDTFTNLFKNSYRPASDKFLLTSSSGGNEQKKS